MKEILLLNWAIGACIVGYKFFISEKPAHKELKQEFDEKVDDINLLSGPYITTVLVFIIVASMTFFWIPVMAFNQFNKENK